MSESASSAATQDNNEQESASDNAAKGTLLERWWAKLKDSRGTILALLILSLGLFVRYMDPWWVETIRLRTFDAYNQMLPRTPQEPSQVTIVDIDEKSLAELGQWPWSRRVLADLLDSMREYQMTTIGFDSVFPEVDRTSPVFLADDIEDTQPLLADRLRELQTNEAYLAEAMENFPTVMGQAGRKEQPIDQLPDAAKFTSVQGVLGAKGVKNPDPTQYIFEQATLVHNLEELEEVAAGIGLFSIEEEVDGVVRRVPMVMSVEGVIKPTLSIETLRVALRANSIFTIVNQGGLQTVGLQTPQGNRPIPVDGHGRIWVYFASPDAPNTRNNDGRLYVSAADILNKRVPPERLRGTMGLLGTSAVGLVDIRATPIAPRLPGVEVHANVIENILAEDYLSYPFYMITLEILISSFIGVLLIFFIPRVGPMLTLLFLSIGIGSLVATSWYLFVSQSLLLDVTYGSGLVLTIFAVTAFSNYARDAQEKRQVRTAFAQYLSPDLVEQLAEHPEQLRLGGDTRRMTLLFCDVRGFTTISEQYKTDPQGLTKLINRLLTPLTNEILSVRGTIDKYMGDCIMAFWNAPIEDPEQELHACQAALSMFTALEALNAEREEEAKEAGIQFLPLRIGIGINTGDVVVGNMGSDQRFDYSVLGDAVNLAARLEGQSKDYGVKIVIGPETADEITETMPVLELDQIAVKGKTEAVTIYTVPGPAEMRTDPEFQNLIPVHEKMLAAYRQMDWEGALEALKTCQGQLGGEMDGFYAVYKKRLLDYQENPPPDDWDGVYVATTK